MKDLLFEIGLAVGIAVNIGCLARIGYLVQSHFDTTKAKSIKIRTEEGELESVIEKPRKKHGLLVLEDGGNDLTSRAFKNTSKLVYETLKEHDYTQDNLYVLEGKEQPTNRFDCHTLPSSKEHLKEVLSHLSREVTSDDMFFMYVLCHGVKSGLILPNQSTFLLDKGKINEVELEDLLSDLHPDHSITYFNSCFGGGFAKRLGKGRNVAISSSRPNKLTTSWWDEELITANNLDGIYADFFTPFFYLALRRQLPTSQTNGHQSLFSIEEAFDYAVQRKHCIQGNLMRKNTPLLVYGKIDPKEVKL